MNLYPWEVDDTLDVLVINPDEYLEYENETTNIIEREIGHELGV
jgi:hypothetical protein